MEYQLGFSMGVIFMFVIVGITLYVAQDNDDIEGFQ